MNRRSRTSMPVSNRRLSSADLPRNARAVPDENVAVAADKPKKGWLSRWLTSRKNRRVKPSKPKKPSGRAQAWLGRLSLMTGIIVVVSASVAVAWGLRRYLRTSPRFAVRTIVVEGNQRKTPNQIAERAGIASGRNIFTVEEDEAKELVEADPWVATAEVHVELPNHVTIKVTEREARALAVVDGELFLVDTSGEIFKELADTDPRDLPVVSGITADDVAQDREALTGRIRRAVDLMRALEENKITKRYPVQELHLETDGAVNVTIGTDGIMLAFGQPPYRGKIDKAERILEELRFRKVKRAVLFLDNTAHPERVVVRLQGKVKEP